MKNIKKNFIAGIGRALGILFVYCLLAIILHLLGIEIHLTELPPKIEGEIIETLKR